MKVINVSCSNDGPLRPWLLLACLIVCQGCGRSERPAATNPRSGIGQTEGVPLKSGDAAGHTAVEPDRRAEGAGAVQLCRRYPVPELKKRLYRSCTVEELEKEYLTRRSQMDADYAGELVEIQGAVPVVSENLGQDPMMNVESKDGRFSIQCLFHSVQEFPQLAEGHSCRIRGVYVPTVVPALLHCMVASSTRDDGVSADQLVAEYRPMSVLTSAQLEEEFKADAKAALEKYTGKVIRVTGRLSRIAHVLNGEIAYRLDGPLTTQFFLRNGTPWSCCRPGQMVTLTGVGFPLYPSFVKCEIVEIAGVPDPILTAASLGEMLEADATDFRQRFYFKQLVVTGEVLEKSQPADVGEVVKITLRSTEKTTVMCEMDLFELLAAESVAIGDTVTITGWNTLESPQDSIKLARSLFWRSR